MVTRIVARGSAPYLPALAATLAPLLALANAGSFHLSYQNNAVYIEQGTFAGVDVAAVDAAVAGAPVWTQALEDKQFVDDLPKWHKAIVLTLLDQINTLRTQPATVFGAVTPAQAWAAVKAKYDSL